MKTLFTLLFLCGWFLCGGMQLSAKDANGLRVTIKEKAADKEKKMSNIEGWDIGKRALGLEMKVQNTSSKDLPEGRVEFTIVVKKWRTGNLEKHSGNVTLQALQHGQSVEKTIGKIVSSGYMMPGNDFEYSDSIEGYRVIISHGGQQTIEVRDPSSFERLSEKAKQAKKPKKSKKSK